MKKLSFILAIITLFTCFNLVACSPKKDDTKEYVSVVDMQGTEVSVVKEPENVLITWTSATEIAVMLGGVEQLQYCYEELQSNDYEWLQIMCPKIKDVPTLNRSTNLNTEWLISNSPDVIISNNKKNVEAYRAAGLTVVYVQISDILEDLPKAVKIIGQVLGETSYQEAVEYCQYFENNVEKVLSKYDPNRANLKSVYLLDAQNQAQPYLTHGGDTFNGAIVMYCGGNLVSQSISGTFKTISPENLIDWNPDIILCGGAKQAEAVDNFNSLRAQGQVLSSLTGQVIRVPQGAYQFDRASAEIALYPLWLSQTLLPDVYSFNLNEEVKNFYSTFFDYNLSEEYLSKMLAGCSGPNSN